MYILNEQRCSLFVDKALKSSSLILIQHLTNPAHLFSNSLPPSLLPYLPPLLPILRLTIPFLRLSPLTPNISLDPSVLTFLLEISIDRDQVLRYHTYFLYIYREESGSCIAIQESLESRYIFWFLEEKKEGGEKWRSERGSWVKMGRKCRCWGGALWGLVVRSPPALSFSGFGR